MTGWIFITVAMATLLLGGWFLKGKRVGRPRRILTFAGGISLLLLFAGTALAVTGGTETAVAAPGAGWAYLGASLAAGLACIGAGIAVAVVGAAALGVVGEKPELLGSTLIYLGLAEGIAIYGVIIALLILGKV